MIEWREKSNLPPPPPRKKIRPKNDITRCTLFADLHARDTQALPRNFRLFCLPEQSLLKSSVPPSPRPPPRQRNMRNLPTPKNPKVKNFEPIQIPRSSLSPEIRSTPSLLGQKYTDLNTILSVTQSALFSHIFCPLHIAVVCLAVL